jgi:hypothetical protein
MINMLPGILGLILTWMTGYILVSAFVRTATYFRLCLGWLVGAGITSLAVFVQFLAGGRMSPWFLLLQLALLIIAAMLNRKNCRRAELWITTEPAWTNFIGAWALRLLMLFMLFSVFVHAITCPALRFDEIHDWGFKALSTALLGKPFQDRWPLMLFPNHIPFLGASVHAVMPAPRETLTHVIPFMYLVSLLGCFHFAAVYFSRSRAWGLPMTLILLTGAPKLMVHADRLLCDLPLAAEFLASFVMAAFWLRTGSRVWLLLSGILAGLCAWTKTDGLLLAAGLGAAMLPAGLLQPARRSGIIKTLIYWGLAVAIIVGPWYIFLMFQEIGMESSGHLGAFHPERWLTICRRALLTIDRYYTIPFILLLVFLPGLYRRQTRVESLFLLATILVGFFHALFPLFLLPEDAFGGWHRFMRVGITRYFLHFMPLLALAPAFVSQVPWLKPFTRVFALVMYGRNRWLKI